MADYWTLQQQQQQHQQLMRSASRRPSILACIDESGNIDGKKYENVSVFVLQTLLNHII
jgi:ABC-type lipoprotein export system ATPase subunit